MKYILINPVVDSMYDRKKLDVVLESNGYRRVECKTAWGVIVKEKYQEYINGCDDTIIDARCPVAAKKIQEEYQQEGLRVASIEPILLHCAREISEREDLRKHNKVITTPCQALAELGNTLGLYRTSFVAWNEFEKTLTEKLLPNSLEASPIPPGFFEDLEVSNSSRSGENEIEEYFHSGEWKQVRMVELLFCPYGCHNGDGVVMQNTEMKTEQTKDQ